MIVVDASVAMKWFVEEVLHAEARNIFKYRQDIQAPDFIMIEIANVAWKKAARDEIERDQALHIIRLAADSIPSLIPAIEILERAAELAFAFHHPVYDCLYLACLIDQSDILVTGDKRFFNKIQGTDLAKQIRFLDDPEFTLPLYISLSKIAEIVQLSEILAQTHKNLIAIITEGKPLPIYNTAELRPVFDSPAYRRLHIAIENLGIQEQADILALGWLGRGHDGNEWARIRSHAEMSMARSDNHFLRYVGGMTVYLEKGLAVLRAAK